MKAVLAILGFAGMAGVPPDAVLSGVGLAPSLFSQPDPHLTHAEELRVWSEAARLTGDQDFGLHLAEWLAPRAGEVFDVLFFALRSCATLGDHYRRACRYGRLVHGAIQLSLEQDSKVARLVHRHRREPAEPTRHPVEGFLTLALLAGRQAIGELAPRAVCFRHARPARISEHERIFQAPAHFGCPRDELVLDVALLDRPQRQAEPRLLSLLNRQLDGMLAAQPEDDRFVDRLQRSMMDELPDREPTIVTIAVKRHMSPRTLQRRLKSEGTTFAAVLSELRRDLALRYLQDPRIAIGEVGFLLGYRDVTAFHRAFKRWTGSTPASYQRSGEARRVQPSRDPLARA